MLIAKIEKILEKVNSSQIAIFAVLFITFVTGVIAVKNEYYSDSNWFEGTWQLDPNRSYQSINDELKTQISEMELKREYLEPFFEGHPESSKLVKGLLVYKGNAQKRWELFFDNISLTVNFGNSYGFFETNLPPIERTTVNSSIHSLSYRNKMFDFDIERIVRNNNEELILKPLRQRQIKTVNSDGKLIEQERAFQNSIAFKSGEYLIIDMPLFSFSEVRGTNASNKVIRGALYFRKIE
ncbi:hypothetical protein [Thalassotalea marina]|uniref:Uncharacterized protein n=1 Tax=Thalassotalea marina TaxID=1673741 RepID=A0A919BAV7_9GAMM|nr:hypothetical protein [Thalassotalea marina]GHF78119.1 hypothetical protein GCM10017161_01450 [Thalassotalea marina]